MSGELLAVAARGLSRGSPTRSANLLIFYFLVSATLLSTAHAMLGALDPAVLRWIDPALAPAMHALRYFGLNCDTPGLAGPLRQQFYINQAGLSIWGVVIFYMVMLIQLLRGRITFAFDPDGAVKRLMAKKNYTAKQAKRELSGFIRWVIFPLAVVMTVLFFNGVYGWSPVYIQPKDWINMTAFTTVMIYMSGTSMMPMYVIFWTWATRRPVTDN